MRTVTSSLSFQAYRKDDDGLPDGNQLSDDDYVVKEEKARCLSLLLYEEINMLGRSSFSKPDAVSKGELRPFEIQRSRFPKFLTRFSVPLLHLRPQSRFTLLIRVSVPQIGHGLREPQKHPAYR